jgi:hypothetical protein
LLLKKILQKGNETFYDYIVSKNVNLRSDPIADSKFLKELKVDEEVLFLEKGGETTIEGITAPWFKVECKDDVIGWCFSGFLEKK